MFSLARASVIVLCKVKQWERQKGARRSHPRVVCSKVARLHHMRERVEDPNSPSSVLDTRMGLHCFIFVHRCKICFLKCMWRMYGILSYFYVQLISPLPIRLPTPHCYTFSSDPDSKDIVSLSNPSGYQKPYQSLPLCSASTKPCFPTACFQLHHFQASRVLYNSLPRSPTFIASSSIPCIQNSTFFTLPTFLPCASKPALFISSFLPHNSMQKCGCQYRDSCCREFCWCLWELAAAVLERENYRFRNTLLKDKKLLCINCSMTVTLVHIITSW